MDFFDGYRDMQLSRISSVLAVIGICTAVLGGCSVYGVHPGSPAFNYQTDRPGHRDIVQVYDLNGHTVIQFREASPYAKVFDGSGSPVNFRQVGSSYELDRIHESFSVDTGRSVINFRRQAPQHERLMGQSLSTKAGSAGLDRTRFQPKPNKVIPSNDAGVFSHEPVPDSNLQGEIDAFRQRVSELTSQVNKLKSQVFDLETARADYASSSNENAVERKYEAFRHYWKTERPEAFDPGRALLRDIEKQFESASEIRIITYRASTSDTATDEAGQRGEVVRQYFLDLGVPKDIISTNILKTEGNGSAARKQLRMAEIRFIH